MASSFSSYGVTRVYHVKKGVDAFENELKYVVEKLDHVSKLGEEISKQWKVSCRSLRRKGTGDSVDILSTSSRENSYFWYFKKNCRNNANSEGGDSIKRRYSGTENVKKETSGGGAPPPDHSRPKSDDYLIECSKHLEDIIVKRTNMFVDGKRRLKYEVQGNEYDLKEYVVRVGVAKINNRTELPGRIVEIEYKLSSKTECAKVALDNIEAILRLRRETNADAVVQKFASAPPGLSPEKWSSRHVAWQLIQALGIRKSPS